MSYSSIKILTCQNNPDSKGGLFLHENWFGKSCVHVSDYASNFALRILILLQLSY